MMGRIFDMYRAKKREHNARIKASTAELASLLQEAGYSDGAANDLVNEHLPMLTRLCGAMDWSPRVVTKAMMFYLMDGGG